MCGKLTQRVTRLAVFLYCLLSHTTHGTSVYCHTALLSFSLISQHLSDSSPHTHTDTTPTYTPVYVAHHLYHQIVSPEALSSNPNKVLHSFNGPLSRTTRVSRYQKCKTNLDFTGARESEWQWHQLGCMKVCTSLQTDNHASTPPLSFLQAGCPSCHPTNSIKALKGLYWDCILDYHTQNEESHVATYQSVNWS